MIEEANGAEVEELHETHGIVGEGFFTKVTYPPGASTTATYTTSYVVLSQSDGTLEIKLNDDEAYEQQVEAGGHYPRVVPKGERMKIQVTNISDYPMVLYKA